MITKRKICIVTGTRADYGLLYWLMKEVAADPNLELQIIATGMHLSPEFGLTYQQIETDGFTIDAGVEMLLSSDSTVGIAKSTGLGVIGFADALDRLMPDILVLLGDRFEILAAAQAAMVSRIPIAHIHGARRLKAPSMRVSDMPSRKWRNGTSLPPNPIASGSFNWGRRQIGYSISARPDLISSSIFPGWIGLPWRSRSQSCLIFPPF